MKNSRVFELVKRTTKKTNISKIADTTIDKIINLEQNFETNKGRWVWELIRNAKDKAYENEVNISIELSPENLKFCHTGKCFSTKDLVFLMELSSNKNNEDLESEEKKIEESSINQKNTKFYSGFITTLLLSKEVNIDGIWIVNKKEEKFKEFQMEFNRNTYTKKEMVQNIEKSQEVLKLLDSPHFIKDFKIGEKYSTNFIYNLDEKGLQVAFEGIQELHNCITLTMVFNPEIKSLRVHDRVNKLKRKYIYTPQKSIVYSKEGEKKLSMEAFEIHENSRKYVKNYLVYLGEIVTTVIEIGKNEDLYYIVPKEPKCPVIFNDFPLIGSQDFPFGCYFNSPSFSVNEFGSGLLLMGESEDTKNNKTILIEIRKQFNQMIKFICCESEKKIMGRHLLAQTKIPKEIDPKWYSEKIQYILRKTLFNQEIIENENGKYIKLNECIIPKAEINYILDLHDLIYPIFSGKIIKKEMDYLVYWTNEFNEEWEKMLNNRNLFDIYNLVDFINGKENVKEILERFNFEEECDVIAWLNNIFIYLNATLPANEFEKIMNTYRLVPNQLGVLCKKNELYQDEDIPHIFKEISSILGADIKGRLMNVGITLQLNQGIDMNYAEHRIEKLFDDKNTNEKFLIEASLKFLSSTAYKNELRKKILAFCQMIFGYEKEEREEIDLGDLDLWHKIMFFLSSKIADRIEMSKSIPNFCQNTKLAENTLINYLNGFYDFISKEKWWSSITLKRIFPNQEKVFMSASDLSIDFIEEDFKTTENEEEKIEDFEIAAEKMYDFFSKTDIANKIKNFFQKSQALNSLKDRLLLSSIKCSGLIKKEFHLADISDSMEKFLQSKKNSINEDKDIVQFIKDFYSLIDTLNPKVKKKYFNRIEKHKFSILSETILDESIRSLVVDLSTSTEFDPQLLKRIISKKMTEKDISNLMEQNKIQLPQENIKNESSFRFPAFDMTSINFNDKNTFNLNDTTLDFDIAENPNDIINFQNNLVGLNAQSEEQFKKLLENKTITLTKNFKYNKNNFDYVKSISEKAIKTVLEYLRKHPNYDLSEAELDMNSTHQNILRNVKKNKTKIAIVIRPSNNKNIYMHNDKEIVELLEPNNELWYSDGIEVKQLSLGIILRDHSRRIIKV